LKLVWSGQDGVFNDLHGACALYDPTVATAGPRALLVRKDRMEKYLADQGLVLLWTVLGGKQYMERDAQDWKGEMQINGAFRLTNGAVEGLVRGQYRTR
jgi:hypothetical protein